MKGTKGFEASERHPRWRGGRTVASSGYVLIRRPDHPRADKRGYIYEHRLVAEEMLGRPLQRGELVHHRNGDKTDNRPENLEVVPSRHHHAAEHRTRHFDLRQPGEDNPLIECACGCSETLTKYDADGRPRRFVSGHNNREGLGRFA